MTRFVLSTAVAAATLIGGSAAVSAGFTPAVTMPGEPPAVGAVFADLAALGYDLGKFKPDYTGRFPYRAG